MARVGRPTKDQERKNFLKQWLNEKRKGIAVLETQLDKDREEVEAIQKILER